MLLVWAFFHELVLFRSEFSKVARLSEKVARLSRKVARFQLVSLNNKIKKVTPRKDASYAPFSVTVIYLLPAESFSSQEFFNMRSSLLNKEVSHLLCPVGHFLVGAAAGVVFFHCCIVLIK